MTSHQIRQAFLDFFRSKEHLIVASAPLVAKNDPTLMFNNSGMAQFKDFFLGNGTPPSRRIADTQKCLRVSGKHNDLEDVGFDTYHHTMFEMLGNWSFGDYFKKEAITWAWELLTEVYQLPKDRLYVSVFEGDSKDGVPFDQEAWDLWKPIVGEDRIILGNKKDNFWEMGDTGPCGPCSEIHIDLRPAAEVAEVSGKSLVNNDHPQVVEIWNLVFMQFERKADSSLVPLPATHVDTGMGFERLCMAVQNKTSNYDTDVFQNTIQVLETLSDKKYGANNEPFADIAMRVIADHIRAVAFAITDGQLPSNNKAGYVIRRILRRAVRYGYSYLGFQEPFFYKLVAVLADQFKDVFPELKSQEEFVTRVILEEEKSFLRTLESGLKRLDVIVSSLKEKGISVIAGDEVFELSDTFGFPVDLTALIAREKGFQIDELGFHDALTEQKNRSRQDAAKEATDWIEVREADGVEFLGYDFEETHSQIIKYRKVKTKTGEEYHIVLDRTPFYAEMGGQVGDTGVLLLDNGLTDGKKTVRIVDTKKENDLFVHISPDKNLDDALKNAGIIVAKIDSDRREKIKANHSATHLMLSAMREVLGTHIGQKGSFLNDEVLRFDFSHFAKVTDEELRKIEDRVNEKIREDIALDERRNVPIKQALDQGATATFGEKYGDFVRLIIFDPAYSFELCGGTHIPSTGQIGVFKFISEGSVSAGVRRVEAVTGAKALDIMRQQEETLNKIKELLKSPTDLIKAVESLLDERNGLQKRIVSLENEKIQSLKTTLVDNMKKHSTFNLIVEKVDVPSADSLKQLSYELRDQIENLIAVFGTEIAGKPQLSVFIAENIVQETGLNAGKIVKDLAKEIRGGGGGQPFFATAGGSDASGLDAALDKAKGLF
ncbi:alanine--tRNA ligase [Dyadobacter fanqingshengii]|uniref:Alanine--tRNA ligase n=1 Tax=Dyadobacter fanqingshengii TaxID=2906443 RepID=A0A9X1T897_9BACT|nr:alanine--tRNA ligase [Dyadobacter fanqingshengii]MCF0039965.1 alanine--tRNA ligase [Dyadobacter fanqingshengii]USJ38279.1 alanine--tRNA ligase [Dyadobacter fanqingshengii]